MFYFYNIIWHRIIFSFTKRSNNPILVTPIETTDFRITIFLQLFPLWQVLVDYKQPIRTIHEKLYLVIKSGETERRIEFYKKKLCSFQSFMWKISSLNDFFKIITNTSVHVSSLSKMQDFLGEFYKPMYIVDFTTYYY